MGFVKLGDFGISKVWNHTNAPDTTGRPGYMAPEILLRKNYGPQCDFFAVGVICHELMMRRKPWKCGSREEYIDDIINR